MNNNPIKHYGYSQESRIVMAQDLQWLPNWLPLASVEPGRVESNLAELLDVARRLWGKDYPEWLCGVDNQYTAKMARVQNTNMWPEHREGRASTQQAAA